MTKQLLQLVALFLITFNSAMAQTKDVAVGHVFHISLPDYMEKTTGLNSAASAQFKNLVKDVAGFIIEDSKEELKLAELSYASAKEFYDDFIKDFLKDEQKRKVSAGVTLKKGTNNVVEADASYYDAETKSEIYYYVAIIETPTHFYKLLCWTGAESKAKFKADFQKIAYSLKD